MRTAITCIRFMPRTRERGSTWVSGGGSAPLLGNNRRKMELLNSLLFSLPGTPVIYYGDEIGMGDNIYLGDRNGVRTPMQWSADRNAGFSRANPQRLYLPVIIDPEHHYETVNVEAQQQNPSSLLWWMKRLVLLRKNYQSFGRGSLEFLYPENHKVLVFTRRFKDEIILIVANLSRFVNYVELDLAAYKGMVPVELIRPYAISHDRRTALLPDSRPPFLLLVQAGASAHLRSPRRRGRIRARAPGGRRLLGKYSCTAGPAPPWSESFRPIFSPAAGSAAKGNPFAP